MASDWEPSDELVENTSEAVEYRCPTCANDGSHVQLDDVRHIVRRTLTAAVGSGELVPRGDAFFGRHDDGTVELRWTGGDLSWISRQMCEEWVVAHNELIAARRVVEAVRKPHPPNRRNSALIQALKDYDRIVERSEQP